MSVYVARALARAGRAKRNSRNPRYFFTIRRLDGEIEDDTHGMILLNDAAALSYAEHAIRQLQKTGGYDDPQLMMILKNETRQPLSSLPFLLGCA